MPNFFKSFFSGKSETPESEKQKTTGKDSRSSNMTVCVHNVWDVRITQ